MDNSNYVNMNYSSRSNALEYVTQSQVCSFIQVYTSAVGGVQPVTISGATNSKVISFR